MPQADWSVVEPLLEGLSPQVASCESSSDDSLAACAPRRRSTNKGGGVSPSTSNAWLVCDCRAGAERAPPAGSRGPAAALLGDTRLYWFDEVPPVLQYNRFVRSGYRAGLSYSQCLRSVLQLHNETGNIWSHLLPLLALLTALATGWLTPWPAARLAFAFNLGPVVTCFMGSVAYHTFMAKHQHYRAWLLIDVCGVFLVFVGGVHIVLRWSLYCYPRLQLAFGCAYYGTAAAAVLFGVRAKSNVMRALPMALLILIRVSLVVVRLLLRSGSPVASAHYAALEAYSLVGGIINILRIPERWFDKAKEPRKAGAFDYWLNSHQLMHLLVVVAMVHLHCGAHNDYWHLHPDPPACPAAGSAWLQ